MLFASRVMMPFAFLLLVGPFASGDDPEAEDQGPSLQMDHDIVSELILLATFDDVADLNLSCGEGWLVAAKSLQNVVHRNETTRQVAYGSSIVKGDGRLRDAMQFDDESDRVFFYEADDFHNGGPAVVANWSATVSTWVRVDGGQGASGRQKASERTVASILQLTQPKACGPTLSLNLQQTHAERSEFELRLEVSLQPWDSNSPTRSHQTLVRVKRAPLSDGKWHHLCLTVDLVNLSDKDTAAPRGGVAALFLDGRRMGRSTMKFPMTFDHSQAALVLGNRFSGSLDHLWIANRVLSDREIRRTFDRPELFR